ncbi:MAG: hypothetical protein IPM79_30065 [Polyangiaceae bacterium]|nr:hypothetical protein [Polyangiaceae bacterium]
MTLASTVTMANSFRRRQVLRLFPTFAAAAAAQGCAALAGEETIEAFVVVTKTDSGSFWGWTEYNLDEPADPDQGATLERVLLRAPEGVDDLRFLTSLFAEVVNAESRTLVAQSTSFPANDTMAPLDILYDGDLRPLFPDGKTIRIEWSGTIDLAYEFPPEGIRVDALIVIEIL